MEIGDWRLGGVSLRLAKDLWREHGLPLLLYGLLTVALTWPALRGFSSRLLSDGGDARNNLWLLWHVKETLLGQQQLFETNLLYYPVGVNLLARGLGPVVGLLALPFWPLGAEAAYNGSLLLGFWLTGYFMYLLARSLGLRPLVAFFAGLVLLVAPVHLVGLKGHMTKTFLGLLPLSLLCLHQALDRERSPTWQRQLFWAVAAAVVLFFTLFHNGYQFLFAILAFAFFTAARFLMAHGAERRAILRRGALVAAVAIALVGPFTLLFLDVAADPQIDVDANLESLGFEPDVAELFLPPRFSLLWGRRTAGFLEAHDVESSIESNVFLSWTGLLLAVLAWRKGPRRARPWIMFLMLCALLALGPSLKWLGERTFTHYKLTILMPYALLTELPGFGFMRAPGRFMMIGSVALAVSAAFGLSWLMERAPQRATAIAVAAMLLVLLEVWPRPWPQEVLQPVPEFYGQIAADDGRYGVFDLPVKPTEEGWFAGYASYYQRYQMVHHKGIASGYLARTYDIHPMFPCVIPELRAPEPRVLVDGEPADCAANILYDLAYFNYRYVVYHKTDLDPDSIGLWGRAQARRFLVTYFGGQTPLVDDDLVTVYAVPPLREAARGLSPAMGLLENWYRAEGAGGSRRWARSPATLFLSVPGAETAELRVTPGLMFEPAPEIEQVLGHHGRLDVALDGEPVGTMSLTMGEPSTLTLELPAGAHTLSLALEAGNFQPVDYDMGDDRRVLSFMVRSIELITRRD